MIQSNELRVGNLLKDQDGLIVVVKGIDSDRSSEHKGKLYVGTAQCYYKEFNGTTGKWLENLIAIPVTEQIVLKCGFKKYKGAYRLKMNDDFGSCIVIVWDEDNSVFKIAACAFYWGIYSLHHLQNLVFFLTGKELEVKL